MSPSKVIFFPSTAGLAFPPGPDELFVPLDLKDAGIDARKAWFRCSVGWNWRDALGPYDTWKASGRRTILSTTFFDALRKPGVITRHLWDSIRVGSSNKHWTILESGVCPDGRIDFSALLASPQHAKIEGLTECFGVSQPQSANAGQPRYSGVRGSWPLSTVWTKIEADTVVIPYDLSLRNAYYRNAYSVLGPMIEHYERIQETKNQRKANRGDGSDGEV
jgi:hypothetical protein